MSDLRALKDKAADLAARGKLERAAETYRVALRASSRDAATRHRLAEVLRRAGRTGEAVFEYALAADQFGRDGQFAKAISVCKTILELDPAHVATQRVLAELYAARERTGPEPWFGAKAIPVVQTPPSAPGPQIPMAAPSPTPATPLSQILKVAQAAAADGVEEQILEYFDDELPELPPGPPPKGASSARRLPHESLIHSDAKAKVEPVLREDEAVLEASLEPADPREQEPPHGPAGEPVPRDMAVPRVPIFSDLSREAFIALTDGMLLQRFRAGEAVVHEGEAGESFYVVAAGQLLVTKRDDDGSQVRLARLAEGDFFGEMALLAGTPRLATVTAEVDAELLEVRAEVLLSLARRFPHLATSLRRFERQRLLANAMAVSPLFRPFSREDRRDVVTRFRTREVSAGQVIIREGDPSDGLYVVLGGAFDVARRRGAEVVSVAELKEGDVFGEMSCLRKTPATATVSARRAGTLLRLPREGFDELITSHPRILEVISELSSERLENLDAILSGRAQWTEEGLVLI